MRLPVTRPAAQEELRVSRLIAFYLCCLVLAAVAAVMLARAFMS